MSIGSWKTICFYVVVLATVFSCANIVRPSGGDKDSEGPKLIGVVPHPGARNFIGKEVVFYFDEFLKPGNYSKEVFISPIPKIRPEITIFNKKLTVRFREPLRENTTYVITLGTEIKDFNEGNNMASSYTYAFSTGDEIDTLEVGGMVSSAWTGKGEDEMTVMLFAADDLVGDSIFGKQPVYVVETDKAGAFKFRYLAEGKYRVYAVRDIDNDFSYGQASELLALTADPFLDLADSATRKKPIVMQSYKGDAEGITVKNVRWANDNVVHVEFNDEPRDSLQGKFLKLQLADSTGDKLLDVKTLRYRKYDRKHLYFVSPHPRSQNWDVIFTNLSDSLGISSDTIITLTKESMAKEDRGRFFESPYFSPEKSTLVFPALYQTQYILDSGMVKVKDSLGKELNVNVIGGELDLLVVLNALPDPKMKYTVHIDSSFEFMGGKGIDSTLKSNFSFPDPAAFGSISGTIVGDSSKPGMKYVVILTGPPIRASSKKEAGVDWTCRLTGPGPFSVDYMPAGTYRVRIIEDTDGNGYMTPGSLFPYRLPEKVLNALPTIEIKGNWDLKNHKILAVETEGKDKKLKANAAETEVPGVRPGK